MRRLKSTCAALAALFLVVFTAGCYQQRLDKEALHGLANDPYPVAPENLAPSIRVLAWPDTITEEAKIGFESRYGVKLEIVTFANDAEAYSQLVGNPLKWDVIMVSQYMGSRMIHEKLLRPVPRLNEYIYRYIDTTLVNPRADPQMKYFVPFDYAALGISFNIDYAAGFPRKWEYLDEHKNNRYLYGRIVMTDDMRYAMTIAKLYSGIDPASTKPEDIATARDFLIYNVRKMGLRFLSDAKINDEMRSQKALIAITWSGEAASILKDAPSCRFLIPEGKGIVTCDGFGIPKNAASPETAALFIEYMLHPYVSMQVANTCMYASVNMRSMKHVDRFIINGPSTMLPEPMDRLHMKHLSDEERKLYEDAWAQIKKAEMDSNQIDLLPLD